MLGSRKINILSLVLIVSVFLILFIKAAAQLDPDFGFRLKTGELILSSGFPMRDPYSYTMPSFPYVEHAWIVAVSWALLFPLIGKFGLAAISSIMIIGALVVSSSRIKLSPPSFMARPFNKDFWYLGLYPYILALASVLLFVGVRAQVVSWFMLAVLVRTVMDRTAWDKWKFATPFFFLFWANLHGGFAAGIAILFLVVAARSARLKKIDVKDIFILLFSLAATLVNPYGTGVWREIWLSTTDTAIRWRIAEWMPSIFMPDLTFVTFATISLFLVIKHRRKFTLEELSVYFLVFLQALASRRHVPLWIIVSLPTTIMAHKFFYEQVKDIKGAIPRFKKALNYAWVGSLIILLFASVFGLRNAVLLSEAKFYPQKAVAFLKKDIPGGQIFSEYGWGGYLVWKLPEKKVFIDGRMPSWRWEDCPNNESCQVFDEYTDLLKGKENYKEVFAKFDVDTVLWPKPRERTLGGLNVLEERLGNLLSVFGIEKDSFSLIGELEKEGWDRVYDDSTAVIYKEPK
ncbi:MAG: hypothetical protein ACC618_03110 [Patescibacteria group bacterium]